MCRCVCAFMINKVSVIFFPCLHMALCMDVVCVMCVCMCVGVAGAVRQSTYTCSVN